MVARTTTAVLLLLTICLSGCSGPEANSSTDFWVRGNCEMCKETIETALGAVPGVAAASYDLESHEVHVDFDSAQIQAPLLHQAVAQAGYDTRQERASEAAYLSLPRCCKKLEDM